MRLSRALSLLALSVAATVASAWTDTGHMVIAAVAKRDLRPEVRAEVERLLAIGGTDRTRDIVTAACWADDVRPERPESGPWHYINYHFRKDGKPVTMKPDPENVVKAIAEQLAILRNSRASDSLRADALRYVLHFVGDIHQPLHTTALDTDAFPKGDRGGNEFKIQSPVELEQIQRPPTNLHVLWDLGAGLFSRVTRPLTEDGTKVIDTLALSLRAALPRSSFKEVSEKSPEKWALEGFELAKAVTYDLQEGSSPSANYMARSREVVVKRAALAGYRLADMLNEALK